MTGSTPTASAALLERYGRALLGVFGTPPHGPHPRRGLLRLGRRRRPLPRPARRHRRQRAGPRPPRGRRGGELPRRRGWCTSPTSSPPPRQVELAERLLEVAGAPDRLGGLLRQLRHRGRRGRRQAGPPHRPHRASSPPRARFHGRTTGALALTHKPAYREPFEPLLPGVVHVPYGDEAALRAAVTDEVGRGGPRADPGRGRRDRGRTRPTCGWPASSPPPPARCSSSTRSRPASAAPAPGSPSSRRGSCPTP